MYSEEGDRTDLGDAVDNAVDNDFVVNFDSLFFGWADHINDFEELCKLHTISAKRMEDYSLMLAFITHIVDNCNNPLHETMNSAIYRNLVITSKSAFYGYPALNKSSDIDTYHLILYYNEAEASLFFVVSYPNPNPNPNLLRCV
jgi:hypothetical protein